MKTIMITFVTNEYKVDLSKKNKDSTFESLIMNLSPMPPTAKKRL